MSTTAKATEGTKSPFFHINFSKTRTLSVLAISFLVGNLLFLPMIALIGTKVPEVYQSTVVSTATLFKDGMLLILGYYFRNPATSK